MAPTTGTGTDLTIDELAAASGTTTRRVRSLQTLGLLPHPELRGRTGVYGTAHRDRLAAILRLQDRGFSLESLGVLFAALDSGRSLADVLGVEEPALRRDGASESVAAADTAELYGFADLQPSNAIRSHARQPLLSLVPTTMWDESEAS
ncbi:MAG TPA: MerR family transcriptional regulator [Acidimicrobiales bacterium]